MALFQKIFRLISSVIQFKTLKAKRVDLSEKNILITGGARGIGAEVSRYLAEWNAHVFIACRSKEQGDKLKAHILNLKPNATVTILENSDTSDLQSMQKLSLRVKALIHPKPLHGLILNAGIANQKYQLSQQSFELQVATNVLGHHVLIKSLLSDLALAERARIVFVTGDIYVLANNCSLDYQYQAKHANYAYARSKLGVSWNSLSFQEYINQKKYPIQCISVHPGVVNSGLINGGSFIKKFFLIDEKKSAQSILYALTEPSLKNGAYIHNVRGIMHLPDNDPVLNENKRKQFWQACEDATLPYIASSHK